jgi:hypothetical protein
MREVSFESFPEGSRVGFLHSYECPGCAAVNQRQGTLAGCRCGYRAFQENPSTYHVRNVETDLRVNVESNSPSGVALRYGQYFQNVSVLNCGVNVTVDAVGSITYEENHTCDVDDVDVKPRLTLQRAFLSAVAALKHAPGLELVDDGACLVIIPRGTKGMGELRRDVLAWTFAVSDGPKGESIDQWAFYVSADDGRVLRYFQGDVFTAAS